MNKKSFPEGKYNLSRLAIAIRNAIPFLVIAG